MNLEEQFHKEMLEIYRKAASQLGYYASYFLRMVDDQGGLRAAKQLLRTDELSDGFTRLWSENRLDLSVEALVLQETWRSLFTKEELATARHRLRESGYEINK